MTFKWFIGLVTILLAGQIQSRELVIAFENTLQPSSSLDAKARSQMLVGNLAKADVSQAMFLIKTYGLDKKDKARLQLYSSGGHLLVNAGHNLSLIAKVDLHALEVGILKANSLLQVYPTYKKHIHFSYLHEYGDKAVQNGLKKFLHERYYRPAFTGIDQMRGVDAYIDQRYQEKIRANKRIDIVKLEHAYVKWVTEALNQRDAEAFNMLGYSPKQILVLQENDLAAYFIAAVVERVTEQGWTIIMAEDAFNDPITNPILINGFGANGYIGAITGLADEPIVYPRALGNRKAVLDRFLKQHIPELM